MIIIFEKLKVFWSNFWEALRTSYNKVFRPNLGKGEEQSYTDTKKINLLAIFVDKLNNLTNTEADFSVISDSTQAEPLKKLCGDIESRRFDITEGMLGEGEYYIFPSTDKGGKIIHSFLRRAQVSIIDSDGGKIKKAAGIIDWYIDKNSKTFFLLRIHELSDDGTLTISYSTVTEDFKPSLLDKWKHLNGQAYLFSGANHIGFGRYKSPASSRGLSPVYGVPLNFGCAEIEERIFGDLKLIEDEFNNGKSKIFADPMIMREKKDTKEFEIPENVFPVYSRAGDKGNNIDIFNPNLRYSEHYSKLVADLALYEKQVGTSKGILTDNEAALSATATAVKRANADTISLIDKIHTALDEGNKMTLEADGVFLNISPDLWSYNSDWYDPFEDPSEQWNRLKEAHDKSAAEDKDLIKWIFPKLTDKEIEEKIQRITEKNKIDTEDALNRIIGGE